MKEFPFSKSLNDPNYKRIVFLTRKIVFCRFLFCNARAIMHLFRQLMLWLQLTYSLDTPSTYWMFRSEFHPDQVSQDSEKLLPELDFFSFKIAHRQHRCRRARGSPAGSPCSMWKSMIIVGDDSLVSEKSNSYCLIKQKASYKI